MIRVIGGGLAGCEAAWQAAELGVDVVIHEMRPVQPTAVHQTDRLAELVCSNSFRGDKLDNAVGLLKEEMRRLGSLVMRAAEANRVPAGADPLGPDNVLGIFPGLLTGTPLFGNRFQAVAKSPKNNGWGDANCGGDFCCAVCA